MQVIQQAYYQYNDFNLSYLTYISICLLVVSHIITAFYWATLKNKPKLTIAREENRMIKYTKSCAPYFPVVLPILLFCRHTELKLHLHSFMDIDDVSKQEMWNSLMEEKMMVRDTANDVKIIGQYSPAKNIITWLDGLA